MITAWQQDNTIYNCNSEATRQTTADFCTEQRSQEVAGWSRHLYWHRRILLKINKGGPSVELRKMADWSATRVEAGQKSAEQRTG